MYSNDILNLMPLLSGNVYDRCEHKYGINVWRLFLLLFGSSLEMGHLW